MKKYLPIIVLAGTLLGAVPAFAASTAISPTSYNNILTTVHFTYSPSGDAHPFVTYATDGTYVRFEDTNPATAFFGQYFTNADTGNPTIGTAHLIEFADDFDPGCSSLTYSQCLTESDGTPILEIAVPFVCGGTGGPGNSIACVVPPPVTGARSYSPPGAHMSTTTVETTMAYVIKDTGIAILTFVAACLVIALGLLIYVFGRRKIKGLLGSEYVIRENGNEYKRNRFTGKETPMFDKDGGL